jgi:CRISPR-associated protein Cmr1
MEKLKAKMRIVTPVFCAGADQKGDAEIRPLSIRGALRWWYRALDPRFREREGALFGATTGEGSSSPVRVRVVPWLKGDKDCSQDLRPEMARQNGAAYLGYTLYLGGNKRLAVPEKNEFELELTWQYRPSRFISSEGKDKPAKNHPWRWVKGDGQEADQITRRAWAASLWLFGHLGGLGTRSRRGFGTIALLGWEGWPECQDLQPAHGAATPQDWKARFENGFRIIRSWFPFDDKAKLRHQHLPSEMTVTLSEAENSKPLQPTSNSPERDPQALRAVLRLDGKRNWYECLQFAGSKFQEFRANRKIHLPQKLAAFGLPIRFTRSGIWELENRYRSAPRLQPTSGRRPTGEQQEKHHRSASRLQFRVVEIGEKFHALAWYAEGPLGPGDDLWIVRKGLSGGVQYDAKESDQLLPDFLREFAESK